MRNLMEESGRSFSARYVSSFQLESLLWNISNQDFLQYNDIYSLKFARIVYILTQEKDKFTNCKEANGIKPLFPARDMLQIYQLFVDELKSFYQWV